MKRDGVDRLFPFAKRDISERVQDMHQKIIRKHPQSSYAQIW